MERGKKKESIMHATQSCVRMFGYIEHMPFAPMPAPAFAPNLIDLVCTMPPGSQKYKCLCSMCCGVSRPVTKHTIEAHLMQDQNLFKSISDDSEFAISVRSHIIETSQLLAQLHGSHGALATAPGAGRSHPDGSEGMFLGVFEKSQFNA
jgi:hypothetical protein